MNVVDAGLGDMGVRLCSRLLEGPLAGWYLTDLPSGVNAQAWLNPSGSSVYNMYPQPKPAGASSHFPYGNAVEPDVH